MSDSPKEKHLETVSFVVHATRGVIRDQSIRRKTMFGLLVVAFILLVSGSTFLVSWLNPREHLIWSLVFWLACLWLTSTALLLAVFDLLIVRREGRRTEQMLRRNLTGTATRPSPSRNDSE